MPARPPRRVRRRHPLRIGIFGARRGQALLRVLSDLDGVEVAAVCDRHEDLLAACRRMRPALHVYTDVDEFFEHDFDAVVLANYANEHGPFAVRALRSGRHVLSEVMAVQTLDEAVDLADAVERSGRVYAYAENYCSLRATLEMRRLYRAGDLGEFLHGEGEYVHNCESIWPYLTAGDPDHWRNRRYATFYCSHTLGPLMTITGTRPVVVVGFETPNTGWRYGMRAGSSALEVVQMSNGATVKSLHSVSLKREPRSVWYAVYGTRGMAESARWGRGTNQLHVYLEPRRGPAVERRYVPALPREPRARSLRSPQLVSTWLSVRSFVDRVRGRSSGEDAIDVYTALDMTVPGILAYKSICDGNRPRLVPDFRDRSARENYRGDNFCFDPRVAGEQLAPSCSFAVPPIPKSVYERQRRLSRRPQRAPGA